jgi:hypothetical protein
MRTENYVSVWTSFEQGKGGVYVAMPVVEAVALQRANIIHYDEYTREWVAIDRQWNDGFLDYRCLLQVPGAFLLNRRVNG